jgi:thioredoxin-related protein
MKSFHSIFLLISLVFLISDVCQGVEIVETTNRPDMSRRSVEPFWWSLTLVEAQARSEEKEGRPILALFTGPESSAPYQKLEAEVFNTSGFKRLGRKQYIPLKLAMSANTHQSAQTKEEYHRLSQEYAVSEVPSFVILESDGTLIAKPDLLKNRKGVSSYSEQVITAILKAEETTGGMSFYMKIGAGIVLGVILIMFLRR